MEIPKYTVQKQCLPAFCLSMTVVACAQVKKAAPLKAVPLTARVDVQSDSAKVKQIIGDEWVGVGIKKPEAIQLDYSRLFNNKPSYKFHLGADDNTLAGYSEGETKGRAELSYAYATHADFQKHPKKYFDDAQKMKTVYHHGKGIIPQGASSSFTFSFYLPSSFPKEGKTIFAQWHGMPDRTLTLSPDGVVKKLTNDEFLALYDKMVFKKDQGYDIISKKVENGKTVVKADKKPNGWFVEQGGYPPLAFGFSDGYFYIKSNSDRKYLTDKSDRTNASTTKGKVMQPERSDFKESTINYRMPFEDFPKDCWITFNIDIDWTTYGGEKETIVKPGRLDVTMAYLNKGKKVNEHIVNNEKLLIGRNDEDGYYFKFGIYRVGGSTVPVEYNLTNFSQKIN